MVYISEFLIILISLSLTYKLLLLLLILLILLQWMYHQKFGRSFSLLCKIPHIKPHIILGNIPLLTGVAWRPLTDNFTEDFGQLLKALSKIFFKDDMFILWVLWKPIVILSKPDVIEIALTSSKAIEKSDDYGYFHPFVGTGLLTSNSSKWKLRRKMLTPAFHNYILNDFIPIMNEQTSFLIKKLKQTNGEVINDLMPFIASYTLDILTETMMGVKINAQNDPKSEYLKPFQYALRSVIYRFTSVLGFYDWIFYRTKRGREYGKCLNYLHDVTYNMIENRKREFIELKERESSDVTLDDDPFIGHNKKRFALLDLLLENHLSDDSVISKEDIRDEVNTFMAAGHETSAISIGFALYLLGLNFEYQQKVYDEIIEIFGDDNDVEITGEHLKRMRYTECCIKETLRIYPSAIMVGRKVLDDLQIKQYTIPKGTTIFINIEGIHHNSELYDNPEVFNPDRFLPENFSHRHTYAYLPFSGGPRNCIGQKFTFIEQKILLSSIIKNFIVKSVDERDKLRIGMELVTRLKSPLRMQFIKR